MAVILEDKLFHSVVANAYIKHTRYESDTEIEMLKLQRIFESGKILCREEIVRKYTKDNFWCHTNYNGSNLISLSKHITRKNEEDCDERYVIFTDENAWYMYPFNSISLVLNKDLLSEYSKWQYGTRIPLEVQIEGSIDLKYLEAISIPAVRGIAPFFPGKTNSIDNSLECYLESAYYYIKLQELIKVMKQYNINVPIVDIDTGIEYVDNIEYREKIKLLEKRKQQYNEYRF